MPDQRVGIGKARGEHLLLQSGDLLQRRAIGELGERHAEMLRRQDRDRQHEGDDQHQILRDLRPGDGTHAAEQRTDQHDGKADIDARLEGNAEETRGDQAGGVELRHHIGERAGEEHDHARQPGGMAAEPHRQEVGQREGPELAQIRGDQHGDQDETTGPAEQIGQPVEAEHVERAGEADEGRAAQPVGRRRHAVEDARHLTPGDIVIGDVNGAAGNADAGVKDECRRDEQIAEDLLRHADLFQDDETGDEGGKQPGNRAVELACAAGELVLPHLSSSPASSGSGSAAPASRSRRSWRRMNQTVNARKAISEPCAAM